PKDLTAQEREDMRMDSKLYESGKVKLTPRQLEIQTDLYDGELAYLDSKLAELVARLSQFGGLERTLLVVLGDHGDLLGEQGEMGHQFALWEPLLHIPLILVAPDHPEIVAAGVRSDYPAQILDVPATLAPLLGIASPGFAPEGVSLMPILRGTGVPDTRL